MWSEPFSEDAIVANVLATNREAAVTCVDDDAGHSFRAPGNADRPCRLNLVRHRHRFTLIAFLAPSVLAADASKFDHPSESTTTVLPSTGAVAVATYVSRILLMIRSSIATRFSSSGGF
jgi:hypothetical protein